MLKKFRFESPVTLLVGENGTGKSTQLEGMAWAVEMVVVGSESTHTDQSLFHPRKLAKYFKLLWTKRTRRGLFLRAEDFFGYANRLNQMCSEMETDLCEVDEEFKGRSDYPRGQAKMSTARELGDLRRAMGQDWMLFRIARASWHRSNRALCPTACTC